MPDFNQRPTRAIVHLDRLRRNAKKLTALLDENKETMAVIKANAYGHGAAICARTLEGIGIKKFGVATLKEGLHLREKGIRSEIYILDGLMGAPEEYFSNRLYPVLFQMEQLKEFADYLSSENRDFHVCLKFDTGMARLGFAPAQIDEIIAVLKKAPQLNVQGIITHLASINDGNEEATTRQITLFSKLREIIKERGLTTAKYSLCNSAALILGHHKDFDWPRPGISLYGYLPDARFAGKIELEPVLEWKSKIMSLKGLQQNSAIGYGGTFVTQRDSRIAVVPVGYADGYPRLLGNKAHVLVNGQQAPVVGRVSMDMITIDVTDIPDARLYDNVTIIGQDGDKSITADDLANWADTISYEILCGIGDRVPRVYEGM